VLRSMPDCCVLLRLALHQATGSGGAVDAFRSDTVRIDAAFESNTAQNGGGAVNLRQGKTLRVSGDFTSNTATAQVRRARCGRVEVGALPSK